MTTFKTESCAGQYKICIETENEELLEQIIAMTSRTIDNEQRELTEEESNIIYNLGLLLEEVENEEDVIAINYAIKAIKERTVLEEKHWSECRQIMHYDNELNTKD